MIEGCEARLSRERDTGMSLAWHIAALGRVDPKKFPSHDRLMQRRQRNRRRMTPEEQWRVMSALATNPSTPTRN